VAQIEGVAITRTARARRKVIGHFRAQRAITPYDTILYTPPPELQATFDKLLAQRVIRREGQNYFWLDLRAHDAVIVHRRRKYVPIVIVVSVMLAIVAMSFYTDATIPFVGRGVSEP